MTETARNRWLKTAQIVVVPFFAACHIIIFELLISGQLSFNIAPDQALWLDRVFSTGTSGSAEMMVLFLTGSAFYVGYLLLLWRSGQTAFSKIALASVISGSIILNALLLSRIHVGGDVIRNISFAAAFLKGYNPYAITGYQLNDLIAAGKVTAPAVVGYLDHRLDYPPITLLYYSAVLLLAGSSVSSLSYLMVETGVTVIRFAGGFLIYKICRLQKISYILPVGLYIMNPLMIYASYDGKEDYLLVTLSLLSLYFLSSRKPVRAGVALALSTLAKYVSVLYWPILAWETRKLKLSLAYVAAIVAASLPFLLSSPFVFSFISFQISRPCNTLVNLFCYDPSHPLSIARITAGVVYIGIFAAVFASLRSEKGFLRMTYMLTIATLLAMIFVRSFFIWYLNWFCVSVYFAQKGKAFNYLLPLILLLVAVPSLFG